MAWEIRFTEVYGRWYEELDEETQDAIIAAVRHLRREGPALPRPLVDTIKGSRHRNLKELRPPVGNVRILFIFDPLRQAILLVGGDKTNRWRKWYDENIPVAERLDEEHLKTLRQEGLLP